MKEPRQFTREEIEQSEKLSQELGSGLFVYGISELPRETPRILDVDIVILMKEGLISEAEKAVYLYRNQWLEKVNKLRLDLEHARKDRDDAAEVILNMLEGAPMEPEHHNGLMMHPGRAIISRIEQSKKEQEHGQGDPAFRKTSWNLKALLALPLDERNKILEDAAEKGAHLYAWAEESRHED